MTVQAPGGTVKIPKTDIETIWRGSKEELLEVRGKAVYFTKGVELYKNGQFQEAALSFERASIPGAMNALVYANLGSAYASAGDAQKAERNFLKALEQKPNDKDTLLNLAHLYESEKNFENAIVYYEKLAAFGSKEGGVARGLAYCRYQNGDFLASAKLFDAMGQKNDIVAQSNAAAAYLQAGEFEKARLLLTPLLEANRPLPRAYFLMATLCRINKDYVLAKDYYQKGLSRDPDKVPNALGLGQLHFEMKEWDKAASFFNQALEKDPQSPDAIRGLARVFAKQKRYDDAVALYEELTKKSPSDLSAFHELGLLFLQMGDPKKALGVYKKLIDRDQKDAQAYANRGLAYAMMNDADNALKDWERALELDSDLKVAVQNRQLLQEVMQGDKNENPPAG